MAGSLSNVSFSLPISFETNTSTTKPFKSPAFLKPIARGYSKITLRPMAMAGESKDNLDYLQKACRQQPQSKKREAQATPIGLRDRFPTASTVQQMMKTMERVLEDPLAYSTYPSLGDNNGVSYRRGRTPWEIKGGGEEFKMRFDMPGMTKKDVKVFVEEKMLVVKAEKLANNNEGESGEDDWFAKSYGRYSSRIALPYNVAVEKIRAEVKDGALYILILKEKASSKILDIDVK